VSYLAAIDQGTTSTRFIVFDRAGDIVCLAQREHEQIYPRPGWVEHDPEEIWQRTQQVIDEACGAPGFKAKDIKAVGITNQRETTIVWDRRTGKAVSNAVVWQDTRVAELVTRFAEDGGTNRFRARTGLPLSDLFQQFKTGLDPRKRCGREGTSKCGRVAVRNR
jgi:glycerol kinase